MKLETGCRSFAKPKFVTLNGSERSGALSAIVRKNKNPGVLAPGFVVSVFAAAIRTDS
jgi:hypothetical protein